MLVVVNGQSRGASGLRRWGKVEAGLGARGLRFEAIRPEGVPASDEAIAARIAGGVETIVAAGGDGTVAAVLNGIMDPASDRPRGDVALGAIGLGSSNDFHKPFDGRDKIAGVPVRVSREGGRLVDVGKAVIRRPDGSTTIRYFLLNASMGIVAAGNAFFNEGDRVVRWLKRLTTEGAIIYSALVNVARYQPVRVAVSVDGEAVLDEPVMNVGVLKSVHFAGGMRYDTPVVADDGQLDVNVWLEMSRARVLGTAAALYRGRFSGRPRTRCLRGRTVSLVAARPTYLELDGEIVLCVAAELSVIPRTLFVCG